MFFINKRKQPLYKKLITVRKNIINKKKHLDLTDENEID